MTFRDRTDAGRRLAHSLGERADAVVVALPRGGVPVAAEIARALRAPLDVMVVRKVRAPGRPELGIGAVVDGERPEAILDSALLRELEVPTSYLRREIAEQLGEVRARERRLRGNAPAVPVGGRTVVVVDDGLATGSTMTAAVRGVRREHPRAVVAAVPVAARDALRRLRPEVDEIVAVERPYVFGAVGNFYDDFRQVSEDEVIALLARARSRGERRPRSESAAAPS